MAERAPGRKRLSVEPFDDGIDKQITLTGRDDVRVWVDYDDVNHKKARKLAGEICRAVNHHDALAAALRDCAETEAAYRKSSQHAGPDHIETGRAWDKMRKAGDRARAVLAALEADNG